LSEARYSTESESKIRPFRSTPVSSIAGQLSIAVLVAWFAVGKDGWITSRDLLFPLGVAIAGGGVIAAAVQRWRGLSWSLVPLAAYVLAGVIFAGGTLLGWWQRFTGPNYGSDGPHSAWDAQWIGDANGDGIDEFVLATPYEPNDMGYGVLRLVSGADGSILQRWNAASPFLNEKVARAGDVDGDGAADVLIGNRRTRALSGRTGAVLLDTDDDWSFTLGTAGDLDGDGADEVLIANPLADCEGKARGEVRVLSTSLGRELRRHCGDHDWNELGWDVCDLGDIDLDGTDDYAISCGVMTFFDPSALGVVRIHSGGSGRLLHEVRDSRLDHNPYVEPAGDADGDGIPDLYVAKPAFRGAILLLVSGRSGVILRSRTDVDDLRGLGLVGDMNGDGRPELRIASFRHGTWIEDGATGHILLASESDAWTLGAGTGDLNGDGDADLLRLTNRSYPEDVDEEIRRNVWRQGMLEVVSGRTGGVLLRIDGDSLVAAQ